MDQLADCAIQRNSDSPSPTVAADIGHGREWWARQSLVDGTDWQSIGEAVLAVLRQHGFFDVRQGEGPKAQERGEASEAWCAPSWREAAVDYHKNRAGRPAGEIEPGRLRRLRGLMAADVSLDRAWHALRDNRPTPEVTVEALMLALRRGVSALTKPDTQRRLSDLDESQLEVICLRVQAFQPGIVERWSTDDVGLLISAWRKLHEQC
jgi:hypothetical protein